MDYTANVANSEIDVDQIRTILVQGDATYPHIQFVLDPSLSGLSWRVRGYYRDFNIAVLSDEITPTETETDVTVDWYVSTDFTTHYGEMQLVLVGTDALGETVVKALGNVLIGRDFSISTTQVITQNLFEQLMARLTIACLKIDQTLPQRFVGGIPKLAVDRVIADDNDLVDKKHVADAVATVTADDFNHNDLSNKQGGSAGEYYHITQAQNAALHAHSNKTALDAVSGTNTGDQTLPTRDSLGLDTDDTVTFANLSGMNTGDQDVSGAISTHNTDVGAHADKQIMCVKVVGNLVRVITKFDSEHDLQITLGGTSINGLPTFTDFNLIPNSTPIVSSAFKVDDVIVHTDWFSPYRMTADSNIDGDVPSSTDFTGGAHGYGGNQTGTPTARCTLFSIFIGGRKVGDGIYYTSSLDLHWKNRIQATNTKKVDGTGREVLEEEQFIHFDGHDWKCSNFITPLEAIKIQLHYGYCTYNPFWGNLVFFHSSTGAPVWQDATTAKNSGDSATHTCFKFTLKQSAGSNRCDVWLNPLEGWGTRAQAAGLSSAFTTTANKTYWNIISQSPGLGIAANYQFSYEGGYRFYNNL